MMMATRAGRAPGDAVRGPAGRTEGELGGLSGEASREWSLQEVVPGARKPTEMFVAVTRASAKRSRACR